MNTGTLNIVTTPIGNYSDITLRALRMLEESDYVICEEYKEASRLLRFFEIQKELIAMNEHNERESADDIFRDLVSGKNLALMSDCGTPLFSDPGHELLTKCIDARIKIEFIGGANSLLAAIVLCGFDISRFYYVGFLSPNSETRLREIRQLTIYNSVIALMDAPYRLKALLKDIEKIFGQRNIFVGFDITMKTERQFRGSASEILSLIGDVNLKGEFIIIIDKAHD